MSLLLARDEVQLYLPSVDLDEHGWRLPGDDMAWSGVGNLQLQAGLSNPMASDGGGRGPYGPARDNVGTLFLPPDAPLLEGSTAVIRGRTYVLSQTRLVPDPTAAVIAANPTAGTELGPLTCWAATATSVDTWPNPEPA